MVKKTQKVANRILFFTRNFPRRNLLFIGGIFTLLAILSVVPEDEPDRTKLVTEPILVPIEFEPLEIVNSQVDLHWKSEVVGKGDNLSTLFLRAKFSAKDVHEISTSPKGKLLRNLFPGESLRFGTDKDSNLHQVHYVKSPLEKYVYTRQGNKYQAEKRLREPEILLSYREGVIKDSLYLSGKEANLPDKLIMEMANIFGWDIDFVFDIRRGDSFSLTYEDRYLEGEKLGTGNIIAASFTNRGKTYQAVRYTNSKGRSNYYTPEGRSMRKAFLRTPLDIFRISSGFNLRRKHPIHKKIKAHRGVDYAAPRGTPVYAAGDGKVIATGYSKPNGNYVFVQHGQTYTTKYLHLNRKKVRKGQTVRQRQLIGTVGSTGYATGPHLHYEFLVNGVHRNPRTVKLPQSQPIAKAEKAAFLKATKSSLAQLAEYQRPTQLASAQRNNSSAN